MKKPPNYFKVPVLSEAILFVIAILLVLPSLAKDVIDQAAPEKAIITSDSATIDRKTNTMEYIGNVKLLHKQITVNADKLLIVLQGNEIYQAIATGSPARAIQLATDNSDQMEASGETLTYHVSSQLINIEGDAYINNNGSIFKGDKLEYSLEKEQIQAQGKSNPEGTQTEQILLVLPLNNIDDKQDE